MSTFDLAMKFTLKAEGGFTHDTGGDTMCGVTQTVYDAYRKLHSVAQQSVRIISYDEVADIMQSEYWNPAHCDSMPPKLSVAMFDWAYNHGVTGAIETLQGCLGLTADGVFGAHTAAAIAATGDGIVPQFLDARRDYYQHLATINPDKYAEYLDGWLNRVDLLEAYLWTI